MHPALHSWREELPATLVRLMAYVGGLALLSILAAQIFKHPAPLRPGASAQQSPWIEIERPFPAFSLSIPEAADVPFQYAVRRHRVGGGRQDVLMLGEPDSVAPFLQVEIYRPGSEIARWSGPAETIEAGAAGLSPAHLRREAALDSKFGPLEIVTFETGKDPVRQCLGFVRDYDDPMLQVSGWFCQGDEIIPRSTLACALDRLALMSAGSEPKIGALFARIELNRSFCGQRDPILASTPKYRLLWKALANRPEPRRSGR